MNEAQLKAGLCSCIRAKHPRFVVFRHEDNARIGVPDISVTGDFRTWWLEGKIAFDRKPRGRGIQKITCAQLARVSSCYYIIWAERNGVRTTQIVEPRVVLANEWTFEGPAVASCEGFNHEFVVEHFWGKRS